MNTTSDTTSGSSDSNENLGVQDLNDQVRVRLEKLATVRKRKQNPYQNQAFPKNLATELTERHDGQSKEELAEAKIPASIAGRIMAVRSFGKAAFVQVKDRSGKIQLYVQKKLLGDEAFEQFKELDIGDIVFAEGEMFKTKTGELSLNCNKLELVTKSLRPLPEKFHGLTDVETRYRQRYLDLIMSKDSKNVFMVRSKIVDAIRDFFKSREFVEVETPMMHPVVGGAAARPFVTHHNTLDMDLYLRIAPELYLKRLVVGGIERVFEINRNFRNEGISIQHNPEFTMLEFYQAYATYEDLMPLTESLFQKICQDVNGSTKVNYQGTEIEFGGEWKKIRLEDAVVEMSGFKDAGKLRDKDALLAYGKKNNHHMDAKWSVGKLLLTIFEEEVEAKLMQPTFVTHYPLDVSPLSRRNEKDPFLVDRFELFMFGRELANGFSELNDPIDQRERFEKQVEAKQAGDDEACEMDDDYVTALEYGMPPAAGQGIGIDRMVMIFTDSPSIRDVILFPQLRKS